MAGGEPGGRNSNNPVWTTKTPKLQWQSGNARHYIINQRMSSNAHRNKSQWQSGNARRNLTPNLKGGISLAEAKEEVALKPRGGGKHAQKRNVLPQHTLQGVHHLRRSP